MTIWKKDYWIGDKPSGNLLIKVMIRESYLDTNDTTSGISSKIANLHNYLPRVGHDISLLNMYVKKQVYLIRAGGEHTSDLLMNLFKAYVISSDRAFVRYIENKLEAWEDGMLVVTPDQLMLWAIQKFDLLKEKGVWNAPSEEEEKLMALRSEVAIIKNKFQDYRQNGGGGRGHGGPGGGDRGGQGRRGGRRPLPAHFSFQPKDFNKVFKWEGKDWHWCGKATGGKCEKMTVHTPNKCGDLKIKQPDSANSEHNIKTEPKEKRLKLKKALANISAVEEDYGSDGYE